MSTWCPLAAGNVRPLLNLVEQIMDCAQKSYDKSITVETTGSMYDRNQSSGDAPGATPYQPMQWQIQDLQKQQPELFQQPITAINTGLERNNLLPGLKVVAMRDKDGIDRDVEGQPIMRSVDEIRTLAADESAAIDKKAEAYTKAYDKFHQGFDGLNPLQIVWPSQLTPEDVAQSATRSDISADDKKTLEALKKDFNSIAVSSESYGTISKDEIAIWQGREQELLNGKLSNFIGEKSHSGRGPSHLDAEGKISILDWNTDGYCGLGNQDYDSKPRDDYSRGDGYRTPRPQDFGHVYPPLTNTRPADLGPVTNSETDSAPKP
ncbi:hypothetical protein BH11CYA1_BH11CYA1_03510 [soil metagenome]